MRAAAATAAALAALALPACGAGYRPRAGDVVEGAPPGVVDVEYVKMSSIFDPDKALYGTLTTEEKLEVIGLFKQAEDGDVTGSQPYLPGKAKNKYVAHAKWKGTSREDARFLYVTRTHELLSKYLEKKLDKELVDVLLPVRIAGSGSQANQPSNRGTVISVAKDELLVEFQQVAQRWVTMPAGHPLKFVGNIEYDKMRRIFSPKMRQYEALTTEQKLQLIGLYKQADQGDVTGSKPFLPGAARNKYAAHAKWKGTPREDAMRLYVARAREYLSDQFGKMLVDALLDRGEVVESEGGGGPLVGARVRVKPPGMNAKYSGSVSRVARSDAGDVVEYEVVCDDGDVGKILLPSTHSWEPVMDAAPQPWGPPGGVAAGGGDEEL